MIDWTPTYLQYLRWRSLGDLTGDCTSVAVLAAMELRGILQGFKPVRLSQLDLYHRQVDGNSQVLGSAVGTAVQFAQQGVCREDLWPSDMCVVGPPTYDQNRSCVQASPNAAAGADRVFHKLVSFEYFPYYGVDVGTTIKAADSIKKAQDYIAAGYPLVIPHPPEKHVDVAWKFDDYGFGGLDGRSASEGPPFAVRYSDIQFAIIYVIKSVFFDDVASLVPPTASYLRSVTSTPVPPPSSPPPTGNTQMLIDAIKTEANALVKDQVTQQQVDELQANVALLVADAASTSTPPPAGLVHDIGPGGSFLSAAGDTWSVVANSGALDPIGSAIIRCNGTSAAGVYGPRVVELTSGAINALRNGKSWQLWNSTSRTWSQTIAPV